VLITYGVSVDRGWELRGLNTVSCQVRMPVLCSVQLQEKSTRNTTNELREISDPLLSPAQTAVPHHMHQKLAACCYSGQLQVPVCTHTPNAMCRVTSKCAMPYANRQLLSMLLPKPYHQGHHNLPQLHIHCLQVVRCSNHIPQLPAICSTLSSPPNQASTTWPT
jgi:hypothetical protein